MSKLFFSSAVIAFLFCCFPSGLCAQQVSARQVAALIEELTALRDEVSRLRMDVEDLRAENARLLAKSNASKNTKNNAAEIASVRVEVNNKLEAQRREIVAEVEKRIARVHTDVNEALKTIRKQVNDALDASSREKTAPLAPAKEPKDLPANGIRYKIKSGDTLSKIAREQRSKIAWILFVNPGLDANRLQLGAEIIIPQAE